MYVQLEHLDSSIDIEWNSLLATKPEETNVVAGQELVASASILIRKWKERVDQYNQFAQQKMQVIYELGPLFEGDHIKEVKG